VELEPQWLRRINLNLRLVIGDWLVSDLLTVDRRLAVTFSDLLIGDW
jgi:hypothetical protein